MGDRATVFIAAVSLGAAMVVGHAAPGAGARPPIRGIVDIQARQPSIGEAFSGTGIVVTRRGEVLTNNHVIRGAESIRVVDPGTGRAYPADVVGYDLSADVAVLQLRRASGLRTITLGNSATVRVGDRVTGYGNAGGRGGMPAPAPGMVTGLGWAVTAFADDDAGAEHLTGMIKTDAPLEPGDSGGPLLDAAGRVVGIDTVGASGLGSRTLAGGYAIPINRVRAIARQIEARRESATVHIGSTAFLGLRFQAGADLTGLSPGLTIVSVAHRSPAAAAGLRAGDVLTAIGDVLLADPSTFERELVRLKPGVRVTIGWTDLAGRPQTRSVVLTAGPPL